MEHLSPVQFLKEQALKLKKYLFTTLLYLNIWLEYKELKLSTCLNEILALGAVAA